MVQGAADEEAHAETGAERVRGAADEEAPAETGAEMVQHAAGEDVRGGRQRGLACVPPRCCEQKRMTRYRGPNTVRSRNGDQLCDWFPPVREFPTVDDSRGSRCSTPTWVQCIPTRAWRCARCSTPTWVQCIPTRARRCARCSTPTWVQCIPTRARRVQQLLWRGRSQRQRTCRRQRKASLLRCGATFITAIAAGVSCRGATSEGFSMFTT